MAVEPMVPAGRADHGPRAGKSVGHLAIHTAEEAAVLLKVKQSWLERQAAARKIPFSMLGGSYRFSDQHIAEIVRLNEVMPTPETNGARRPPRPRRSRRGATGTETGVAPLRPRPANPRRGPESSG